LCAIWRICPIGAVPTSTPNPQTPVKMTLSFFRLSNGGKIDGDLSRSLVSPFVPSNYEKGKSL